MSHLQCLNVRKDPGKASSYFYRWLNFICEIPSADYGNASVESSVISQRQTLTIIDERGKRSDGIMRGLLAMDPKSSVRMQYSWLISKSWIKDQHGRIHGHPCQTHSFRRY